MGSESVTHPHTTCGTTRRTLRRAIARQRDGLLDWEIVIDDIRHEIARHVDVLREAVREHGREAAHLHRLLELLDQTEAVA